MRPAYGPCPAIHRIIDDLSPRGDRLFILAAFGTLQALLHFPGQALRSLQEALSGPPLAGGQRHHYGRHGPLGHRQLSTGSQDTSQSGC